MTRRVTPRSGLSLFAAVLAGAGLATAVPQQTSAKNNSAVGAAIVGGIVGIGVGAALSDQHHHNKKIYYNGYNPPYAPGAYDPYFAKVYSPASNVVCYSAQRVCYNNNGSYASKWTRRVYGY
ncbi:hypothetical protein [Aestuariivirga sp.]|uniref:hypothetical protein n=1 Tax=Aestuariivirga sp. TaxID=2650926 RepID=UPI003594192D